MHSKKKNVRDKHFELKIIKTSSPWVPNNPFTNDCSATGVDPFAFLYKASFAWTNTWPNRETRLHKNLLTNIIQFLVFYVF